MNVDETLKLALKFHNNNDLKKANKLYDGILALYINHPDANHLSGLISLSTGNFDDALAKIEKAIATLPREAIYYNSLGNVFKLNEEYSKAESAYFAALEIDPRLHEASHNLGKLYEKTGNLEKSYRRYILSQKEKKEALISSVLFLHSYVYFLFLFGSFRLFDSILSLSFFLSFSILSLPGDCTFCL